MKRVDAQMRGLVWGFLVMVALVSGGGLVLAQETPAQVPAEAGEQANEQAADEGPAPLYISRTFNFEDVDVGRLAFQLRTFGIPVPVELEGNITAELRVSIPLNRLTSARVYRFSGELTSEALTVNDVRLGNLDTSLAYDDGMLRVSSLRGQLLDPTDPERVLGVFRGEGVAQLVPVGDVRATLRLNEFDLQGVNQFLAQPVEGLGGRAEGIVELTAPVDALRDPQQYQAIARVVADRVVLEDFRLANARAEVALSEGVARFSSVEMVLDQTDLDLPAEEIADGPIRGAAVVQLFPLGEANLQLEVRRFNLVALPVILSDAPTALADLQGRVTANVDARVPMERVDDIAAWSVTATTETEQLRLGERPVEIAPTTLTLQERLLSIGPVEVTVVDATATAAAQFRLLPGDDEAAGWLATVRSESMPTADLVQAITGAPLPQSTGTLSFDFDVRGSATAPWAAAGTVQGEHVHVAGLRIDSLAHRVEVTPEQLLLEPANAEADAPELVIRRLQAAYAITEQAVDLQNLVLEAWGGELTGQARWSLEDAGRHTAVLDWSDLLFEYAPDPEQSPQSLVTAATRGHVDWSAPASETTTPAQHVFTMQVALDSLGYEGNQLGQLLLEVTAQETPWRVRGAGELAGAPLTITGNVDPSAASDWDAIAAAPGRAEIIAGPFDLRQVWERVAREDDDERAVDGDDEEPRVAGTAAMRMDVQLGLPAGPSVWITGGVEDPVWGERSIGEAIQFTSALAWDQGRLRMEALEAQVTGAGGERAVRAEGVVAAHLSPLGPLAMDVDLRIDSLAALAPLWSASAEETDTALSGQGEAKVQLSVPLDAPDDLQRWMGTGTFSLRQVVYGDRVIDAAGGEFTLADSQIRLADVAIVSGPVTASARGDARLVAVEDEESDDTSITLGAWKVYVDTQAARLASFWRLITPEVPEATAGYIAASLVAEGEGKAWQVRAAVEGREIHLAGFPLGRLDHILQLSPQSFDLAPQSDAVVSDLTLVTMRGEYDVQPEQFSLANFQLAGWDGRLAGNVRWARTEGGTSEVNLEWADLRLPVPDQWTGMGELAANTAGAVQWSAPRDALDQPAQHRFVINATLADIRGQGVQLGDLGIDVNATDPQAWQFTGEGTLLGGPARLAGRLEAGRAASWSDLAEVPSEIELAAGPLELGRLFAVWQDAERASQWRGSATLEWTARSDGAGPLATDGAFEIRDLRFGTIDVTDRLRGRVSTSGSNVAVNSISGTYAGGRVSGSGRWSLAEGGPRTVNLQLSSIDSSRMLLPISPDSRDWFSGPMSANLTLSGRDSIQVNGRIELRRGAVFSLPTRMLRASLRADVALPSMRWSARLSDIRSTSGRGRVTGYAHLEQSRAYADRFDLDSRFEADSFDFQELLGGGAGGTTLGNGSMTGTVVLQGQNIEDVSDLEGVINAELDGTDPRAIPGLLSARSSLGVLSLSSTQFSQGGIQARLRRGELRISELWLTSSDLRLWAEGQVSLRSGRLDVDAVVATGDFERDNAAILALAQTIAVDTVLPISALTRVNQLLSNRVVNLAVRGTYRQPRVSVRPAATLTQNAARFFLREAAGLALPGVDPLTRIGGER